MKIQQLEYIIAIAQAGSITAAAKNLYQAQPNISIALKELESEIGIQIFWRTPNGMVLTPEGEGFLIRAKDIVESIHSLESDYTNHTGNNVPLKLASASSSYIAPAVCAWVKKISHDNKINISILEVQTNSVIDFISNGKADIGIIRIPQSQYEIYQEQLNNRRIAFRNLMTFRMKLLMRADCPLAQYRDVPIEELRNYTEIIHGDDEINLFDRTFINKDYEGDPDRNRICVHDSGNKIMLLDMLENTYMWVAPSTLGHIAAPNQLIVRECSAANIDICDMLICKKNKENNRPIKACMDFMEEFIIEMNEKYENLFKRGKN